MWIDSGGQMQLKDIAVALDVVDAQVRKWKKQDDWEGALNGYVTNETNGYVTNQKERDPPKKRKSGAPPGNKNAAGNKGGPGAPPGNKYAAGNSGGGAPPGNKNALTHGRYETISWDALDDEERELLAVISTDPVDQLDSQIRELNLRKRRMMLRIKDVRDGLTEKGRRELRQRMKIKEVVHVHDDKTGSTKTVPVERHDMVTTEIEETEVRKIEDIIRWESELTAVEKTLTNALKAKAAYLENAEKIAISKEKLEIEKERLAMDKSKIEGDDEGNVNALDSLAQAIEQSRQLLQQKKGDS